METRTRIHFNGGAESIEVEESFDAVTSKITVVAEHTHHFHRLVGSNRNRVAIRKDAIAYVEETHYSDVPLVSVG